MKLDREHLPRIFEENYAELLSLAKVVTEYHEDRARELVHEVFVRFSGRDDLPSPEDFRAYMFVVLRNTYRSKMRRRLIEKELLVGSAETIDATGKSDGNFDRIDLEDDIRMICRLSCIRRETSISGSLILLRYFHDFSPNEVSRISRRSRNAIESRIAAARRDILYYAKNPETMRARLRRQVSGKTQTAQSEAIDFEHELREIIFSFRKGPCYTPADLEFFYRIHKSPPSQKTIAHIVTCERCLTAVCDLLGIGDVAQRHPLDGLKEGFAASILLVPAILVEVSLALMRAAV